MALWAGEGSGKSASFISFKDDSGASLLSVAGTLHVVQPALQTVLEIVCENPLVLNWALRVVLGEGRNPWTALG